MQVIYQRSQRKEILTLQDCGATQPVELSGEILPEPWVAC